MKCSLPVCTSIETNHFHQPLYTIPPYKWYLWYVVHACSLASYSHPHTMVVLGGNCLGVLYFTSVLCFLYLALTPPGFDLFLGATP